MKAVTGLILPDRVSAAIWREARSRRGHPPDGVAGVGTDLILAMTVPLNVYTAPFPWFLESVEGPPIPNRMIALEGGLALISVKTVATVRSRLIHSAKRCRQT